MPGIGPSVSTRTRSQASPTVPEQRDQLVERPAQVDQPATRAQRHLPDRGRRARGRLDDRDRLLLLGLTEVELEQRAGVAPRRGGPGDPLRAMDVAEGEVAGVGRQTGRRHGVFQPHGDLALAAASSDPSA